jgi:hypothetical protein
MKSGNLIPFGWEPLCSTATAIEYEVKSILEHRGPTAWDLECLVKWLDYADAAWKLLESQQCSSNELLGECYAANGLRIYQWMRQAWRL